MCLPFFSTFFLSFEEEKKSINCNIKKTRPMKAVAQKYHHKLQIRNTSELFQLKKKIWIVLTWIRIIINNRLASLGNIPSKGFFWPLGLFLVRYIFYDDFSTRSKWISNFFKKKRVLAMIYLHAAYIILNSSENIKIEICVRNKYQNHKFHWKHQHSLQMKFWTSNSFTKIFGNLIFIRARTIQILPTPKNNEELCKSQQIKRNKLTTHSCIKWHAITYKIFFI